MTKRYQTYHLSNPNQFKHQLINFLRKFNCFSLFDSNSTLSTNSFDFLAAFKQKNEILQSNNPFLELNNIINDSKDWLFGYLGYDLKNDIEQLFSNNLDHQGFPNIHFFTAEIIIKIQANQATIFYDSNYSNSEIDILFNEICNIKIIHHSFQKVQIYPRVKKADYIKKIQSIKEYLQAGDIYEMNYCQEFYSKDLILDPFNLFINLNIASRAPFSTFYRLNEHFCLCASPERYLKKEGHKIISQPIKGTINRLKDSSLDNKNKEKLLNSSKNFSENVMIVDLVRNDLSKVAKKATVNVDKLADLYTYKDVHHLVSTISCELDSDKTIVDLIKASFPMGSMTGAPKIRCMQLIEEFEDTFRGLYSGAIGYITPNKDFDFNVVIRSIFYNQQSEYLSFMVGGAITIDSDPESEYEECLVKAKSIFKVLGQ